MKQILHQEAKVVSLAPVTSRTAGTASTTGIDRKGFFEALVVLINGDLGSSATVTAKVQDSADNSTFADVTGAAFTVSADATDDGLYKLGRLNLEGCERYIRIHIVTATATSHSGALVILSDARDYPVTNVLDVDFNVESV